jgi:2-polyprenyl-6-methoxyphenol hydroxylase-like FAD-dependent oxidoreductase
VVDADAADDATALKEQWAAMLAGSPNISPEMRDVEFPGDFARIRREFGHAERYGSGAVVLMGDALHPVSPAGGQGANMSVADALALAEILPEGGPDVIERYESLRRRANARSLRVTAGAARLLASDAGPVTRALGRLIISLLVGHPRLMRWPVRFLASAFRSPDGAPTMPSRRR